MDLDEALALQQELDLAVDAEDDEEGYSLKKDIIREAWVRYRPSYNESTPGGPQKVRTMGDLKKVFSTDFINYFISKINLKIYDFSGEQYQIDRKKRFKKFRLTY